MASIHWHTRYLQQAMWTADLRRYWFEQIGLSKSSRALEVGCGTGAVLATLALSPGASLHGLDIDYANLLETVQHCPNARVIQGDALRLPYVADSFDIVYCHFVLLWVSQPDQALAEMVRCVRPGGWVLALAEPDYGGRIDYPADLQPAGRLQAEALRSQGADPGMGRKLRSLFHGAGLAEISAGVLGGQWKSRPPAEDDAGWQQEWAVLRSDLGDRLTPAEWERLNRIEQNARRTGERILFVPTFYAIGKKATTNFTDTHE